MNFLAILVAALSTFALGAIWYNPKVFGTAWMQESGMTEEKAKKGNMAKIFGFAFLFAILLAFIMPTLVIHETGVIQAAGGDRMDPHVLAFLKAHGGKFSSFKHGALHGAVLGVFFVLPVLGTNSLFEQRSWKYIFINAGYWTASLIIMGGILSAWQ
ncbi:MULTISPECIES: DUF1761 domain-containing protein [Flavobacterium]|uniref:DUF1761 domain-containing protein n=1 Tax=Flavobacterium jumunjinense TaxID=998845 RepID=A0ABV5GNI2_9FLAO|nr:MULTISPECIES: DUF1761 domain-containing protein [Flavobacterium]